MFVFLFRFFFCFFLFFFFGFCFWVFFLFFFFLSFFGREACRFAGRSVSAPKELSYLLRATKRPNPITHLERRQSDGDPVRFDRRSPDLPASDSWQSGVSAEWPFDAGVLECRNRARP